MNRTLLLLPLVACAAVADEGLFQAGTKLGPVRDLNCATDAGLLCTRNTTLSRGDLRCNSATATEPGCVTPSPQTFGGDKTFTGTVKAPILDAGALYVGTESVGDELVTGTLQMSGVPFASLPSCTAGKGGLIQVDTTNQRLLMCDSSGAGFEPLPLNPFAQVCAYYDGTNTTANLPLTRWGTSITPLGFIRGAVRFDIQRAGSDGAHTFTYRVYDETGSAALCTSSSLSCNLAAGLHSFTCGVPGAFTTPGHAFQLQIDMSACTGTIPTGNLCWSLQ